jgi:SsrA-binding protein
LRRAWRGKRENEKTISAETAETAEKPGSANSAAAALIVVDVMDKTEREKAQTSIAENRKAFHDYHLLETFEAGIVLLGTEVKAIREGRVNLRDSFARVEDGEVFLYNVNISPYSHRGYADHEPLRRRKLLLHRDEIRKLIGKTVEKGMTLVPVRLYYKNGRVKVAVSLAKGKKEFDKRETIKRREADRETRAAIKSRR